MLKGELMVDVKSIRLLPRGVKEALLVSINRELEKLGNDDGYASEHLGRRLCRMGLSDSKTVRKEDLENLRDAI